MPYDVCIVGGGIVGLSSAYFLAKLGLSVNVIERDSIGSHASGFAYGSLSPLGEAGHAEDILPELEIARMGMDIHALFSKELVETTGIQTDHRFRPALDLIFTEPEAVNAKEQVEWRTDEKGYKVEWLSREEALKIVPHISKEIIGAVYTEGVADVEPYKLMLALTQGCELLGVSINHGNVVNVLRKGYEIQITTESGSVTCKNVVLAMGPWMGSTADWLGVNVPIKPLKGQILRLNAPDVEVNCSVGWKGNYACTKPDGLLWAGTTEEDVGFNDIPTPSGRDQIIASLNKMIPNLDEAALVQHTACLRPLPVDGKIILGAIPADQNIFLATGTGRKGILLGPAMGNVISQLITGQEPEVNITSFSPARFN
ncbi:MAG: NAD(P)/FAD-dependent oxidoreductase [Dehalococcoidia bacterium]